MELLARSDSYLSSTQADIRQQLTTYGFASMDEDELTVSTNEWRRIARNIAADLDRPIRTTNTADRIYAVLMDWPKENEACAFPRYTKQALSGSHFFKQLTRPGTGIGQPV